LSGAVTHPGASVCSRSSDMVAWPRRTGFWSGEPRDSGRAHFVNRGPSPRGPLTQKAVSAACCACGRSFRDGPRVSGASGRPPATAALKPLGIHRSLLGLAICAVCPRRSYARRLEAFKNGTGASQALLSGQTTLRMHVVVLRRAFRCPGKACRSSFAPAGKAVRHGLSGPGGPAARVPCGTASGPGRGPPKKVQEKYSTRRQPRPQIRPTWKNDAKPGRGAPVPER